MKNASNALLIAAEVLIGLLVISLGIFFLKSLSKFGNSTIFENKERREVIEFNKTFDELIEKFNVFSKIYEDNSIEDNYINLPNVGDIVTVMNYAKHLNLKHEDDSFVKIWVNNKELNYYYQREPNSARFNEEMYKFIESNAVFNGPNLPKKNDFKFDIRDVNYDSLNRIREMKIDFYLKQPRIN